MTIKFTETQRGGILMLANGYVYTKHGSSNERTRWRCQRRRCSGMIVLKTDNTIFSELEHDHPREDDKIKLLEIRAKIREKAITTRERASDIVIGQITGVDAQQARIMPNIKSMMNSVNRTRNHLHNFVPSEVIDIPVELQNDARGEPFFRFDSGVADESRFVIFVTEFKKKYLEKSKIWLIDGTFKVSPHGFLQIVTIHGNFLGRTYPLAYIFLKKKTESSYQSAFRKLSELFTMSPAFIITDFEKGLINAAQNVFTSAESYACLFHLGQAVWRWIQNNGFAKKYKHDKQYKLAINLFLDLTFVPVSQLPRYYKKLLQWIANNNVHDLATFQAYFERMYVGSYDENNNCLCSPIFSTTLWNSYDRVLNNIPRTTNSVEGWHRAFNARNEIAHPNIARLIAKMKDEEERNVFMINQSLGGKITMADRDFKKEATLIVACNNIIFFDEIDFLTTVDRVYHWNIDTQE